MKKIQVFFEMKNEIYMASSEAGDTATPYFNTDEDNNLLSVSTISSNFNSTTHMKFGGTDKKFICGIFGGKLEKFNGDLVIKDGQLLNETVKKK